MCTKDEIIIKQTTVYANDNPCWPLMLLMGQDFLRDRLCDLDTMSTLLGGYDSTILYAVKNSEPNKPIGLISVRIDENVDYIYILAAYVHPDNRGLGIYSKLSKEVEQLARNKGKKRLLELVASHNKQMKEISHSLGWTETYVTYQKLVSTGSLTS